MIFVLSYLGCLVESQEGCSAGLSPEARHQGGIHLASCHRDPSIGFKLEVRSTADDCCQAAHPLRLLRWTAITSDNDMADQVSSLTDTIDTISCKRTASKLLYGEIPIWLHIEFHVTAFLVHCRSRPWPFSTVSQNPLVLAPEW